MINSVQELLSYCEVSGSNVYDVQTLKSSFVLGSVTPITNAIKEPVPGTFGTLGSLVHSRTRTF